jgi:hypothetical protein
MSAGPCCGKGGRVRLLRFAKLGGYWDIVLVYALTIGELVCVALDVHGLYRDLLATGFVLYCPGAALLMRVRLHRGIEGFTYSVCLSIAVGIFASSISYYAGIADPIRLLHLEAVLVFLLLLWEIVARISAPTADDMEAAP